MTRHRTSVRRVVDIGSWAAIVLVSVMAIGITVGLVAGYRPIAITTGSMAPWAPTGSLVVARPVPAEDIVVGDVIVMQHAERSTITHRVIERRRVRGQLEVLTQGDANDQRDADAYRLADQELVGSFALPYVGRGLAALDLRSVLMLAVLGSLATLASTALRLIWEDPEEVETGANDPPQALRTGNSIVAKAGVVVIMLAAFTTDVSLAAYTSAEQITDNTFESLNCFMADGVTLQRGTAQSTADETINLAINAVDPSKAFLQFSIRSGTDDAADSMVRGELTSATTVTFTRNTDAFFPPTIDIEWAVIEYACGVAVQRGSTVGNNGAFLDVPIAPVPASQSFSLVSAAPGAAYGNYDFNEIVRSEVLNNSTLRLTADFVDPFMTYAWQVVTFTGSGAASVQNLTTSFLDGETTNTLTLATPVDLGTTLLIGGANSSQTGANIGERHLHAELTSPTTVQISRGAGTGVLGVGVQVVQLNDGSAVQRGVVTLPAGDTREPAALAAVDQTIATAFSTVNLPGSASGGSTDYTATNLVGEASATFTINTPTQLVIERNSQLGSATFAWQVVEWGRN